MSLLLSIVGMALWIYAVVREVRGTYSYSEWSASVGRWGSLGLIVVSSFAEGKLSRYLLFGAAGLLFFFGSTIGDITI